MTHHRFAWRGAAVACTAAALLLTGCGGSSAGKVKHSIGGTVTGLAAGNSLVISNGADAITVNADGRFGLPGLVAQGQAYRLQLAATTPMAQPCTSTYGVGTMGAHNITNVSVICGLPGGAGAFTASGSSGYSRVNHTATRLANGQVLIAAGFNPSDFTPPAELYDPVNGTVAPTGVPATQRLGHTATRLANGKVLVTGGITWVSGLQIVQSSAELYDPATGLWTPVADMDTERAWHTASLLPDGMVLVAGGRDTLGSSLAGAELFDPSSGQWIQLKTMRDSRWDHTAVLLPNGKVLVTGGEHAGLLDNQLLDRSELFDPDSRSWSATGRMSRQRSEHTATLLPSGKVLVVGGSGIGTSAELYDPVGGVFTAAPAMAELRRNHSATLLPTGQVMVAGGEWDGTTFGSTELYDPVANRWEVGQPMLSPRYGHAATLLSNGKLLLNGGSNVHDHLSTTEIYH